MGWIFAVAILWFAFGRRRAHRWWGRGRMVPLEARTGAGSAGAWGHHRGRSCGGMARVFEPRERTHAVRSERAPEPPLASLKRRYVAGELSDEQYERELDVLFRTTTGRGQA